MNDLFGPMLGCAEIPTALLQPSQQLMATFCSAKSACCEQESYISITYASLETL